MEQLTTFKEANQLANNEALHRLNSGNPVLVDVKSAREAIPGFADNLILTSGAPLDWPRYIGGQRNALISAAIYEGLAQTEEEAKSKFSSGAIQLGACHDYGCVGSVAGVYTASMPVFVVKNEPFGNIAYCNFYEGKSPRRLNYGVYDDAVRQGLDLLRDRIGPQLAEIIRSSSGIPLRPLMARAIHMGDELHSRNTAATTLFANLVMREVLRRGKRTSGEAAELVSFLGENDYFFLRLGMAAAKAIADSAHRINNSSVVTAMTLNCREFAIRVSGLGSHWFRASLPKVQGKFFEGFSESDIEWMGGESCITETIGVGALVQAAAFSLHAYQGGSSLVMASNNELMYKIAVGESTSFHIPFFNHRGSPVGIDVIKVCETGITPYIDAGLAGKGGGQIGAGLLCTPIECFEEARRLLEVTLPNKSP